MTERAIRGVVGHLIASNFAGGPEKQILELSERLQALGWPVVIGSFRENRPEVEVITAARERGLQTFLIDTRSPFSPAALSQVRRQCRAHHIDIMVTHGYKPNVLAYLALHGEPVVQVPIVRGYTAEDWKVRVYEALDRWLLRRFQRVLTVSNATRGALADYGIARERIEVIHNAVHCEAEIEPRDLRAEFGFPANAEILLSAGRLSPEKGQRYLIDAFRQLPPRLNHLHLLILGSGREEARLRERITAHGLTGRIVLGGFKRPILPYLAAADLVVNPSLSEGLPNVILEALSVRTPVVATDVGGVAEIIFHERTGWLVPPARSDALASAISSAWTHPATRARVAAEGYRLIARSFSFANQAARFAALCEDLLKLKEAESCG